MWLYGSFTRGAVLTNQVPKNVEHNYSGLDLMLTVKSRAREPICYS